MEAFRQLPVRALVMLSFSLIKVSYKNSILFFIRFYKASTEADKHSTRNMPKEAASIQENTSERKSTFQARSTAQMPPMAAKSRSQNQTLGLEIKEASRASTINHLRKASR